MAKDIEKRIRKKIYLKRGFFIHFYIFFFTSIFLFALNQFTLQYASVWWWYWPVASWGLGIAIHYLGVFGFPGQNQLEEKWEREEIEREMRRLESMRGPVPNALPEGDDSLRLDDELKLPEQEKLPPEQLYDDKDLV